MDPAILAATAGNALIIAMTTDAWQQVRSAIVSLWRRARPEDADTIEAALGEIRGEILAARRLGNTAIERDLVTEWQHRLLQLIQGDQDIAEVLQSVLDEVLIPAFGPAGRQRAGSMVMTATASGQGRVYQAGRDQGIVER